MSEWISVNIALPSEIGEPVLIFDGETQYVGWIDKFGLEGKPIWSYSYCCGCFASDITHWMPLPKPPEDE